MADHPHIIGVTGPFLCALCATSAASGFRQRNQRSGSVLSGGFATSPANPMMDDQT